MKSGTGAGPLSCGFCRALAYPGHQSARLPQDLSVKFKLYQNRRDPSRRGLKIPDQLVLCNRAGSKTRQNLQVQGGSLAQRRLRLPRDRLRCQRKVRLAFAGWCAGRPKHIDHICGIAHQRGTVADQHVAPGGPRIKGMSRHGEHFAPLVQRVTRSDQTAGACSSLDDDRRFAQPCDDPVSAGEMTRHRLQAHGLFRDPQAPFCNIFGQFCIFSRVHGT